MIHVFAVRGVKRTYEHSGTSVNKFIACPNLSLVESYLRNTVEFSGTIKDGDQVCYKFLNEKLKSDECMMSSEDIVSTLKDKQVELERIVDEFQSTTPESCVKLCLQNSINCV